jgi:hypothetical protein
MSSKELETTTVEYPVTETFQVLFDELVDWATKIQDIASRLKKYPRDHDEFYQAMADLDVIVTILPVLGRSLRKEMDHLDDLFPEEDEFTEEEE